MTLLKSNHRATDHGGTAPRRKTEVGTKEVGTAIGRVRGCLRTGGCLLFGHLSVTKDRTLSKDFQGQIQMEHRAYQTISHSRCISIFLHIDMETVRS